MATTKLDQHKTNIQLALCRRDYELVSQHHPDLLDQIEAAVSDGATPEQVKRWAMATVDEPGLVQRVYNAAKYAGSISQ